MATIKTNERELSAKVTQWFDEIIRSSAYAFKEASSETGITADKRTLFADTIIWYDRQTNQAASYIELKPPSGRKENLETFKKKATSLRVRYAFTWNFQTLKCFEIKDGQLHPLQADNIAVLSNVEEWKRIDKQVNIKSVIGKICDELSHLLETGKPRSFIPDKVFFIELIRKTTNQLLDVFESFIHQAQYKKEFKGTLTRYARLQGIPTSEDHVKILTNHVVYGFITKVIFYLTIRRYFTDLPPLDEAEGLDLSVRIRKAFAKARERDWQAVFEEDPIEELGIPKEAHKILYEFFSELRAYHFGELPEDVLGQLFEEIIDPEKRHSLGQYFTREDLVDLVIATVVQDKDGIYCDPTCGSGTFLVRLYDRLRFLSGNKKTHTEMLNQIWGFDIGKFPAELSTINLFRQSVRDYENFPRVRKTDIFYVLKGNSFPFPPPHSGSKAMKVNLKLPEFNAVVGNFPYIRQELIEKEFKGYKRKVTKVLAEEYLQTYPKLFELNGLKLADLTTPKQIEHALGKDWIDLRLSGQADIYTYIYLHTATLLNREGAFAIITSNAWLDVGYGSVLKQFMLDHFCVKMIIASWVEPWFEDAAVNTVITVLEKEENEEKRKNNSVHFVKLKKKLTELVPHDLKFDANRRWHKFDAIVATIEESEYKSENKTIAQNISSYETEEMRVRIISQQAVGEELTQNGDLAKWGKYLRAPDVYFEIIDKCHNNITTLNQVTSRIERGNTTGINEFFYLEKIKDRNVLYKNDRGWIGEIEDKYLVPVLMSPKDIEQPLLDWALIKTMMFVCNECKSNLRKMGDIKALKYIEWGEKQVTIEKQKTAGEIPWPEVPSVKGRKYWYAIDSKNMTNIVWSKSFNDRYVIAKSNKPIGANNRLYQIIMNNKSDESKLFVLWNSTLQYLFIETFGRVNLGDGLIDNGIDETKYCLTINPDIKFDVRDAETKLKRNIKPIFDEVKNKDRKALDIAILKSLGLDPDKYLPRIYDGLCEMVRERLDLPKMRKKQQKETVKIAVDKIKKTVAEECLANGPKRFPEQFYDHPLTEKETERFSTSGEPLRYEHFFGQYQMIDTKNQKLFTVDSESKAQFAQLLAKLNVYELRIPKDENVITIVLQKYYKYRNELEETLKKVASQQTHDWAIAERIAKDIITDYGL